MNDFSLDTKRRNLLLAMSALPFVPKMGFAAPMLPPIQPTGPWILDVHTHIFNARDVPAEGYLHGPVIHDLAARYPQYQSLIKLARKLVGIVDVVKKFAPTAKEELADLDKLPSKLSLLSTSGTRLLSAVPENHPLRERQKQTSTEFYKALNNDEVQKLYRAAVEEHEPKRGPNLMYNSPNPEKRITQQMVDEIFGLQPKAQPQASILNITGKWTPSKGLLEFCSRMLSSRFLNVDEYFKAYPHVTGIFAAMVNFDGWFSTDLEANSPFSDQIKLMGRISKLTDYRVLPIVAYNPLQDERSGGEMLRQCLGAIDQLGFVGVKLYPPNGFSPDGKIAAANHDVTQTQIEARLMSLYSALAEREAPVMAHSFHSLGETDDDENLADPQAWEVVLDRLAKQGKPPIHVNVAHFTSFYCGPESDDKPKPQKQWPSHVRHLFDADHANWVYADLAYHEELLDCDSDAQCQCTRKELLKFVNQPIASGPMTRRLMYGTDWFMFVRERDYRLAYDQMLSALNLSAEDKKDLSYRNALRLFGLDGPHSQNYRRLVQANGRVPQWLGLVQ